MNSRSLSKARSLATAAALIFASTSYVQAAGLPQVRQNGSVEYLSGGIGSDESQAIEAARPSWPLSLEFAVQGGARADYAADVHVVISTAGGQVVLDAVSEGPFLLARVPPGTYGIDATLKDKRMHRTVTVSAQGGAKASFVWPAGGG